MIEPAHSIVHLNAGLNASAAALLAAGGWAIKTGRRDLHAWLMRSAFAVSAAFLACYLWYHYNVGSVRYPESADWRGLYLGILLSHTVLAVVVLPMILRTLFLAWKERFAEHRRLARWTLPLWFYVSFTGVVVYAMLYHLPH